MASMRQIDDQEECSIDKRKIYGLLTYLWIAASGSSPLHKFVRRICLQYAQTKLLQTKETKETSRTLRTMRTL